MSADHKIRKLSMIIVFLALLGLVFLFVLISVIL
jgi:hypothetical protein